MDNSVRSFHDGHVLPFLCSFDFFCRHFGFEIRFGGLNQDILLFLTQ